MGGLQYVPICADHHRHAGRRRCFLQDWELASRFASESIGGRMMPLYCTTVQEAACHQNNKPRCGSRFEFYFKPSCGVQDSSLLLHTKTKHASLEFNLSVTSPHSNALNSLTQMQSKYFAILGSGNDVHCLQATTL